MRGGSRPLEPPTWSAWRTGQRHLYRWQSKVKTGLGAAVGRCCRWGATRLVAWGEVVCLRLGSPVVAAVAAEPRHTQSI